MFYGTSVWDPVLIIAQILSVQSLFYIGLGTTLFVFLGATADPLTVAEVFDYRKLSGWRAIAGTLAGSVAGALVLLVVVERTKKCLDFTVTCYVFHLIFCTSYGGFPLSLEWWITIGLSAACMTLLGESLCMKKELRDIPTALPTRNPRANNQVRVASSSGTSSKRQRLINFLGGN